MVLTNPFEQHLNTSKRRDITSTKEGYVALEVVVVVVKDQKFRWHLPFQLQQNQ